MMKLSFPENAFNFKV